jgi:hypothetical protein
MRTSAKLLEIRAAYGLVMASAAQAVYSDLELDLRAVTACVST